MKVAVLMVATGKYDVFVHPLIQSFKKHFLRGHEVRYVVWTDKDLEVDVPIYLPHEEWPGPTLHRYRTILSQDEYLSGFDYLYYVDVDMVAVDTIGDEILGSSVAVLHPAYVGKRGTPERRRRSTAYIGRYEKNTYYAGGFQGGETGQYLAICRAVNHLIEADEAQGITAIWHDESYFNRVMLDNPPTRVLSPEYCYPEGWRLPYKKRLVALDKDHKGLRL